MAAKQSLYSRVIDITEDYMGPAAARFINRIATNHLGKPATQIAPKDIPELVTWVQLAANVMTENSAAIEQYGRRLQELQERAEARKSSGIQRMHHAS